jgi:aminoglycoside 3-N-acetyltransferase
MTTITQHDITHGLRELGLRNGDRALVHSALSSFGHVEGGADAVIDALLETVGPAGTLLVPTLTGSEELSPENPPVFDSAQTPCWTGRIPETSRQRPDAIRSLHPTHSVAAIGADAAMLTRDHLDSITPCDALSPYGKLAQLANGYILLLGVDHESNTTMHHIEELAGVDYHMQPGLAAARIVVDGAETVRHILLHAYGTERHFNIMEPVFVERGIQRNGQIGDATLRLIHAGRMVAATLQAVRANPRILCAT